MNIFLYGPSGSGKSTVGEIMATDLNLPFLDLDIEIETVLGQSISQFMTEQGEMAFRDVESSILIKAVEGEEKVIVLGGGALLRDKNRALVDATGQVVFLGAELSSQMERLTNNGNQRPLLAGELQDKLSVLLASRGAHYDSFPLRVNATSSPEQVAWDIQRILGRYHPRRMGTPYDVVAQEGGVDHLGEMLKARKLNGPMLVISDTNIAPHYAGRVLDSINTVGYTSSQLVIPAGENHKNLETVTSLWRAALEADLDRKSTIVALGGGVIGDMSGFVAATFMRSCNWVAVPTTLLAMVDASIGGKTGFDLPEGKNLVGAFNSPRLVLADPDVLSTLPERELRAGLAEVVKHGLIADPELFNLCTQGWDVVNSCLSQVVRRGMAVKVKVIEEDPYERGIRAALNLGHTVGHAVELVSNFTIRHGEAVAIGLVAEARLAERLGIAGKGLSEQLVETLLGLDLPVEIPADMPRSELVRVMRVDKKKEQSVVKFALPVKIGKVKVGVAVEDLEIVFEEQG